MNIIPHIIKKILENKICFIFIFILSLCVGFIALNRMLYPDEFYHLLTSIKILKGQIVYVDFFRQQHHLYYLIIAQIVSFLKDTANVFIFLRLFNYFLILLTLMATYFLGKVVFNQKVGLISIIALASSYIFVNTAIEIRPDLFYTLFGILTFIFYYFYILKKDCKFLFFSSIFLGLSFIILQKAVFFIFAMGCIMLFDWYKKNISFKNILIYFTIFFVVIFPYYFYFIQTGTLKNYFICNWLANLKFINDPGRINMAEYVHNFKRNILLWILFIIGCFYKKENLHQKKIVILSLILIGLILKTMPMQQYFMPLMPFVCVIASYSIWNFSKYKKNILVILLILISLYSTNKLIRRSIKKNIRKDIMRVEYVLKNTDKDDFVYDNYYNFNIYRNDIESVGFWKNSGGMIEYVTEIYSDKYGNDYDIIKEIKNKMPKIITKDYVEKNIKDEKFRNQYKVSKEYNDLLILKGKINHEN